MVVSPSDIEKRSSVCGPKVETIPVAADKELRSTQTIAPDKEVRPANQDLPQLRPSIIYVDGFTDLHRAAFDGDLDRVIKLVNDEKEDLNVKSNEGWTPLPFPRNISWMRMTGSFKEQIPTGRIRIMKQKSNR
jgi:hypothetical protein